MFMALCYCCSLCVLYIDACIIFNPPAVHVLYTRRVFLSSVLNCDISVTAFFLTYNRITVNEKPSCSN